MSRLKDQILSANRAYILALNDPRDAMSRHYYSIYLDNGNGLEVLWPDGETKKDLEEIGLYHFRLSENRRLPYFHAVLSGCGYNKEHSLACELRKINPDLLVHTLGGYSPSLVSR